MSKKLELMYKKLVQVLNQKSAMLNQSKNKLYQEQARFLQISQYCQEYNQFITGEKDLALRGTEIVNLQKFIEHLNKIKFQQMQIRDALLKSTAELQLGFNQQFQKNKAFREHLDSQAAIELQEKARSSQRTQDKNVTDWYNNKPANHH